MRFDIGAINNVFSKMFGAGFYYKTFMRPKALWKYYEHFIRSSAGFRAPAESDPDTYEHRNAHCDVLVAGGGPSGLAALNAAKSGARVIIADENADLGGSLLGSSQSVNGAAGADWVDAVLDKLAGYDNVTLLPRSTVFGYYDHNFLAIAERCTDHLSIRIALDRGKDCGASVQNRSFLHRARSSDHWFSATTIGLAS